MIKTEIEIIASVLNIKIKEGRIKNPVGMLINKPEIVQDILKGQFYSSSTSLKVQEEVIYSLPEGVTGFIPINHREREAVHGKNA